MSILSLSICFIFLFLSCSAISQGALMPDRAGIRYMEGETSIPSRINVWAPETASTREALFHMHHRFSPIAPTGCIWPCPVDWHGINYLKSPYTKVTTASFVIDIGCTVQELQSWHLRLGRVDCDGRWGGCPGLRRDRTSRGGILSLPCSPSQIPWARRRSRTWKSLLSCITEKASDERPLTILPLLLERAASHCTAHERFDIDASYPAEKSSYKRADTQEC
ncbi:uncharacterized protein EI97DRAFT_441147 [Westerdykella ornata]|uniref:Uncharacterized protein n=1 Tax=Westerdykella ornata TaxID=318751 RepID=A0A6A6JNM5_WESOR|nr:uncharacterized protein EI97DRAFT_441147 [Westerdykella ornata]KAF2277854.1 hypothetical protein EI97DRAFT_441147 [Westerdykella ornata]